MAVSILGWGASTKISFGFEAIKGFRSGIQKRDGPPLWEVENIILFGAA